MGGKVMKSGVWKKRIWVNRLQSLVLVLALLGISTLAGGLLFGEDGLWIAFVGVVLALVFEPMAAWRLTLHLYRARPIHPDQAPELWRLMLALADKAQLPAAPALYYVPSPVVNAFAVGTRGNSAIALSNGLLNRLSLRELAGVLAHEMAHIVHGDLRVMSLADYISRLTHMFALAGQFMLLLSLPLLFIDGIDVSVNWAGLLLLLLSPQVALLMQLGLSRLREYDADLTAVALTGDPAGLASALARIERSSRSWLAVVLPGWGNPEPSWLRTHPATEERIRRLQELTPASQPLFHYPEEGFSGYRATPLMRNPRWRIGGLWR